MRTILYIVQGMQKVQFICENSKTSGDVTKSFGTVFYNFMRNSHLTGSSQSRMETSLNNYLNVGNNIGRHEVRNVAMTTGVIV